MPPPRNSSETCAAWCTLSSLRSHRRGTRSVPVQRNSVSPFPIAGSLATLFFLSLCSPPRCQISRLLFPTALSASAPFLQPTAFPARDIPSVCRLPPILPSILSLSLLVSNSLLWDCSSRAVPLFLSTRSAMPSLRRSAATSFPQGCWRTWAYPARGRGEAPPQKQKINKCPCLCAFPNPSPGAFVVRKKTPPRPQLLGLIQKLNLVGKS